MAPSLIEQPQLHNGFHERSIHNMSKPAVARFVANGWDDLPPSRWSSKIHPLEPEVTREVDEYFLQHWPFKTDKDRKKFVAAGFSRVTCLYFPAAKDDRIAFASKLLTILFLIDDLLEDMSFEDGSAYNNKLMPIARGDVLPDRTVPVEWMMYDLWEEMRAKDKILADQILEPTFTFMRAQTDKSRLTISELGHYLTYREKDVGKALLCALMRFAMELHLNAEEIASAVPIEQNCAKHLSVVNDILSWDKEYIQFHTGHPEGSAICSAIQVLATETCLPYSACKRVLWVLCREWEKQHEKLVAQRLGDATSPASESLRTYIKGLEYQMSGNEYWSLTTLRYNSPN
ncbi:Aristolochene synthase prx2 [Conoideocrella luteorostrata]|uniref:Terpene synthase n=1 Tax=Conoideocrella luteorostrata TaxID=1105319 RepID=A0AAJ0FZ71_9HYPO|nr:Aristolochene synthase prx2 [Conoideocrella luteorostrata]